MRICNIIQCANLGGMEQSSLLLLKKLKTLGHDVELMSLQPLGGMEPLLSHCSIPAEGLTYRGLGGWRSLPDFRRKIRRKRCDALIMTGHNLLASAALGDFCQDRRILAVHFHHAGVKPLWQWRLIYRTAMARFQAIVFPSDFIRREAEAIYPPIMSVSHTVGCPVELFAPPTSLERQEARAKLGLPQNAHIVGNAGWLIPRKRFDVFLRVAHNIAVADPNAIFVIAGDGSEAEALRELGKALGLAERVRWLGWQEDLRPFYQSLDLLLFNSDWDAMGRTPLEGLAFGVPVVASVLHGGLHELLSRESYGPIFTTHDIAEMTRAAMAILRDRQTALRLLSAGRRQLASLASPSRHTNQILRILGLQDEYERGAAQ